ncbi:MAG TPA: metalloregulator ArsR/SmtB family transcription factor [Gaiellaceae bacterium]|jgi:DNA-binding transcriptional ArsR family regulator
MSEAREGRTIARPLPLVGDGKPLATPQIVHEPRNVTVEVFRALADPIRLELLALIAANGPICVCHLEEALSYKQSRISKHLGTLRRAGLVRSRRQGTWVYYDVNEEMLDVATSFIGDVQASARTPHEADYCAEPK